MHVTFGSAAASVTRYEMAWSVPHSEPGAGKESNIWWLESHYANGPSACNRLREIQEAVCAQRGSAAVYEVNYDNNGRIISERVVAHCGSERPPLRSNVRVANKQLRAAFARLAGASSARPRKHKSATLRRVAVSLMVMAGFAGAAYAAVGFAGTPLWQTSAGSAAAPKVDANAGRKKNEGQILVPRANSEICDRYMFDNSNGAMRPVEALPCDQRDPRKATATTAEQTTSFTSGWRGAK